MIKINLITNESLNFKNENYFCNNKEIKTLTEGLSTYCFTQLFGRTSKKIKAHKILYKKITHKKNIFSFLILIYKEFKKEKCTYLVVSLSPYTFLSIILFKIFKKKYIILLRSDGFSVGDLNGLNYNCLTLLLHNKMIKVQMWMPMSSNGSAKFRTM